MCALSGVGVVSDTEREISTGHGSSCHSLGTIFILSPLQTSLQFWLRAETFNDHHLLEEDSIIGDSELSLKNSESETNPNNDLII